MLDTQELTRSVDLSAIRSPNPTAAMWNQIESANLTVTDCRALPPIPIGHAGDLAGRLPAHWQRVGNTLSLVR
jgi:hypothetical protein